MDAFRYEVAAQSMHFDAGALGWGGVAKVIGVKSFGQGGAGGGFDSDNVHVPLARSLAPKNGRQCRQVAAASGAASDVSKTAVVIRGFRQNFAS